MPAVVVVISARSLQPESVNPPPTAARSSWKAATISTMKVESLRPIRRTSIAPMVPVLPAPRLVVAVRVVATIVVAGVPVAVVVGPAVAADGVKLFNREAGCGVFLQSAFLFPARVSKILTNLSA